MFDPEALIQYGGLLLVFLAIYGQTGLFFCFFLPSGGLLFMAGVLIATGVLDHHLLTLCGLGVLASLLGNITGYVIGYKTGPVLYRRNESRFFKKAYLTKAENFYKRYGGLALSIGVFLPLIRTFGPIVAGIIKQKFGRFLLFVFIGSAGWILSFALAGYLIGSLPFLRAYLNYAVIAIVVLVTTPVVVKIIREFKSNKQNPTIR
ncbi:DedA family protein [Niabella beijingensis]|uniref:DedA family protein n=1 Tax=Niabella beijingensis TaxID=2872700 RepID=UPI001CBDC303|nr:VTT domain-containing protein [Niabella beijingensis]MBZ4191937.1 VTT domain-containing protein [Niabella beijingensis]